MASGSRCPAEMERVGRPTVGRDPTLVGSAFLQAVKTHQQQRSSRGTMDARRGMRGVTP